MGCAAIPPGCGRGVARAKSPEIVKRNDQIYAEWQRGVSLTDLGAAYSLSRQLVGRIVASYHPEEEEDGDRALYRGFMWRLYDEVQEIGEKPGYKMRPDGRPAEDMDGNPALDTMVQVQCKELQLKIIRELRLLDARDRVQPKQLNVEFTVAQQAMMADIEQRRKTIVVTPEPPREIEPGQPVA